MAKSGRWYNEKGTVLMKMRILQPGDYTQQDNLKNEQAFYNHIILNNLFPGRLFTIGKTYHQL